VVAAGSARGFAKDGYRGWALYSDASALLMAVTFGLFSAAFGQARGLAAWGGLFQRASIVTGFGWLTALFVRARPCAAVNALTQSMCEYTPVPEFRAKGLHRADRKDARCVPKSKVARVLWSGGGRAVRQSLPPSTARSLGPLSGADSSSSADSASLSNRASASSHEATAAAASRPPGASK
jgi:hypothetical protein